MYVKIYIFIFNIFTDIYRYFYAQYHKKVAPKKIKSSHPFNFLVGCRRPAFFVKTDEIFVAWAGPILDIRKK